MYKSDIEIAQSVEMKPITEIAKTAGVDEKYLERVMKRMPLVEMKQAIKKMSPDQLQELVLYASSQNDIQLDRITAIKELTGTDLFKVIELKMQREE